MRALLLLLTAATAAAEEPLYDFDAVPITKLTDENFDSTVTADLKHVWVVEYYADWCGHCKQFAKGYGKAATNLEGLVRFGAVNADIAKKTVGAAGVQGFPTVKVYLPEVTRNPYTGKLMKTALDYSGPRTAKGVVEFVTNKMPSKVVSVNDASLAQFRSNGTIPKALLLTKKDGTTPLFKSLSLKLAGRMLLGEARDTSEAVVQAMGAADFPALFLLGANEDTAPKLYEGELKPAMLTEFLEANAGPEPVDDVPGAEPLFETVKDDNYAELVQNSKDVWLLVFGDVATDVVNSMAEAVYGQAKVGKASLDAAFGKKLPVKDAPIIVVLPYGDEKNSVKKASTFDVSEQGVEAAKKAALETLPYNLIPTLNAQTVDQYMSFALAPETGQIASQSVCLLFSDKPTPPPLFRSVALAFEGEMAFGMIQSSDSAMMQRFGISKAPAILVMYPEAAPSADGQMKLAGMKYEPRVHGPFRYGYIANFVGGVIHQRYEMLGKKPDEATRGMPKKETASAKKELGPLPELSASNFEDECTKKGGLCAIAMLDGGPDNTNKEAHLEMLTKMRKKRAGGPLVFSWIDATCHTNFAAAFNIYETDLPAFIVLSPSKRKWARAIGAFDADSLGSFGTGVATGRIRTDDIAELPSLEDVDCALLPRGSAALPEETPLDDDIMAEILEEERKEREAREAEVAASMASETPKAEAKDKSKMTKLEKLEADLEECGSMDLLCAARREKQLKAIEKERALQDKLKEIAKKKKKKAKKAKKA